MTSHPQTGMITVLLSVPNFYDPSPEPTNHCLWFWRCWPYSTRSHECQVAANWWKHNM